MSVTVRYGIDSELALPDDPQRKMVVCRAADEAAIESVETATRDALAAPLDYPTLSQALVPGDKVVLALDRNVPAGLTIATTVAEQVCECGLDPADVTLLTSETVGYGDALPLPIASTVPAASHRRRTVHVALHDPTDRGRLSYLANTKSGRPIYLNRALLDADMVVPIGCMRGRDSWGYRGIFGAIYPNFSDVATQARFRNPHLLDPTDEVFGKSQQEIDAVGWLVGAQLTVQALPGPDDSPAGVVAGEISAVARYGEAWWNSTWRCRAERRADVVVAALSGRMAQSWEHFGRALHAAAAAVDDGGAVVVCTDLDAPLGPALELFAKAEDRDEAVSHVRRERPVDAPVALELARTQRTARVYFLGKLDPAIVDQLGMTAIDEPADVGRLIARRKSCIVLADAQYVSPAIE